MQNPDISNELFQLAAELVNNTAQHIFLTGKAGTGKTTFLRYIREITYKNIAVVAPTGVAAINAGGVTMHSFFNLPFEPFLPVKQFAGGLNAPVNKNNIFHKTQLSKIKREVMEELELLIIDEVSMLRADKLDAIDTILRGVRRSNTPFGGVQVLFIGDMYQLPPVATDEDWEILKDYYASPFFFDAVVLKEIDLTYVELKKIYRQKEQQFIDLLNNIRNNTATENDLYLLHSRYDPDFRDIYGTNYITITTHNYKADAINNQELQKLKGPEFIFKGVIEGEFSDKALPTEINLILKAGAQIMFIKNDSGEDRNYYNGKLAVVKSITQEEVIVTMQEEGVDFTLKQEVWENVRYSLNKETGRISEDVLGTFKQFPIRLAWAITIHKSQGLTFEKVIIDAGQSFAAGQVYVALSRCTTLDGMTLLSRIHPHSIATDERIIAFSAREKAVSELEAILMREQRVFLAMRLLRAFQFSKVIGALEEYHAFIPEKNIPEKSAASQMAEKMVVAAHGHQSVAERFCSQLRQLLAEENPGNALKERTAKAITWFAENVSREILVPLHAHIETLQHASKVRQYMKVVNETYQFCENHLRTMIALQYNKMYFIDDREAFEKYFPQSVTGKKSSKEKKAKVVKGESQLLSLQLFKSGKKIDEIAKERNLAISTIESHLAGFVLTGEIDILELMPATKYNLILNAIADMQQIDIAMVRNIAGEDVTYGQVRAVQNAREKELQEQVGS